MARPNNKYGLSRDIPEPVRRQVRQRCGFGCVLCGCAIIQNHHFDPPFEEAREHLASGITLLCGRCHDKRTRGMIGDKPIREADANPFCRRAGVVKDILFEAAPVRTVRLGCLRFSGQTIIQVRDTVLFGFSQSDPGSPLLLNASLPGAEGKPLLGIVNNEWQTGLDHFDVYTEGPRLFIKENLGETALEMLYPGNGDLELTRLTMQIEGFRIDCRPDAFHLARLAGGSVCFRAPPGAKTTSVIADIGLHITHDGDCLIAANRTGGAAVCLAKLRENREQTSP